ncbi:hypothetical protein EH223_01630 [candidate division KSB1 bacterium]|nr:serine hydrolase [candidate division KSB1 bacterium]RQW06898.1 MAG: hypothetical protein EH223_01630 [candidate division KSB1 bacterium]
MKTKLLIVIYIFMYSLLSPTFHADQTASVPFQNSLPFQIPEDQIRPLLNMTSLALQEHLVSKLVQNVTWESLIRRKKMAVGVVDLRDLNDIKYASVNGNKMMYAASLPKLAILLGAAQALENGSLQETEQVLHDMRIMISKSDNEAATRMIDRIGFDQIEQTLCDPRYELYDIKRGGGLWVGKRYAKTGKRHGDPMYNISHGATVTQVCRFYYLLAMGKLVSWDRSKQMLDIMVAPEIHHKFVNSFDRLAPEATVYRKSGTWKNYHADSALIWGPVWRRYIVVGLVEDSRGEEILRELIPTIEQVLLENSGETKL